MSLTSLRGDGKGTNGNANSDAKSASIPPTEDGGFTSKLSTPKERFLAAVVDHALSVGRRTAKDFIRHFSPRAIMEALKEQPRLRAKLLVSTTGINEKIAIKKPASSAGEDLELAIAEGVTEEGDVVSLFDPDDRVTYLDHGALWAFLIEGEFWRIGAENVPINVAREHIAFILSRARAERLLSDREIIDGITLATIVESLPKEDLGRVLEKALSEGRAGRVFKDERVLDVLTPATLAEHVSLATIWEKLIAHKLGFRKGVGSPSASSSSSGSGSGSSVSPAPTSSSSTAPSAAASEPKTDPKVEAPKPPESKPDVTTSSSSSSSASSALRNSTPPTASATASATSPSTLYGSSSSSSSSSSTSSTSSTSSNTSGFNALAEAAANAPATTPPDASPSSSIPVHVASSPNLPSAPTSSSPQLPPTSSTTPSAPAMPVRSSPGLPSRSGIARSGNNLDLNLDGDDDDIVIPDIEMKDKKRKDPRAE